MPSAAQGWRNKKTFEEEGISYRYDLMGKSWKSSIMTLTHITPKNSQKPLDVTYRLQRVRPSGISTFVHPATFPFLLYCMGRPRNASAHPTPTFANAGFIITHLNNHSGQFIWWQGVTIRAEQGYQRHQMLLDLINWVSTTMLSQEGQDNVGQAGTHGWSEALMGTAAQRHRD